MGLSKTVIKMVKCQRNILVSEIKTHKVTVEKNMIVRILNNRNPSDETMQKFHSQIFQMLNTRLTDTFRFYAPLLAALPAFGYVLLEVLREGVKINNSPSLLDFAYLFSMLLLLIGAFYLFAVSYTYRALQMVLAKLEDELALNNFTPPWDPRAKLTKDKTRCEILKRFFFFWIIPEILKPHLYMFLAAAIFVIGAQFAVLNEVYYRISIWGYNFSWWWAVIVIIFSITGAFALNGWYLLRLYTLVGHDKEVLKSLNFNRN